MKNILKTGLLSGRLRGVVDVNGVGGGNTYEIGGQYRNLAYAYNTRGFIQSRADSTAMQCETYTYDNLDRLSSYTVNGGVVSDVFYNLFINPTKMGDGIGLGHKTDGRLTLDCSKPTPTKAAGEDSGRWHPDSPGNCLKPQWGICCVLRLTHWVWLTMLHTDTV